jgi:tetratricopeptide (TPR) repeat protein
VARAVEVHEAARSSEPAQIGADVIGHQPADPHAARLLPGMIADQTRTLTSALSLIEQAINGDPSDPDLHTAHGAILQRQGRLEEALAAYDRAVSLKPDYALAHAGRGRIQFRCQRATSASLLSRSSVCPTFAGATGRRGTRRKSTNRQECVAATSRSAASTTWRR